MPGQKNILVYFEILYLYFHNYITHALRNLRRFGYSRNLIHTCGPVSGSRLLDAPVEELITFTGLINYKLPSDYNTKIASMEALMM